jgi:DNA processing protein
VDGEELADWLRLTSTPGIGDITARKLLSAFGLPGDVLAQSRTALQQVVSPAQAAALHTRPPRLDDAVAQTSRWLAAEDHDGAAVHRIVTLGDPGYPAGLLEMADPPLMLYLIGPAAFDLTQLADSIAMVGSRNPTPQGEANAREFARAFGDLGIPVVSGLALGVDGAAHQGALDAVGTRTDVLATVAVVGTGLDRIYPARHHALAHRISARGLIVSEFPLGTPPLNQNFPKRNRIIAGLSRGTLVVEAALQSGSLITARLAVEQGREVFAIPGSIHSPQARGCHALIRQGAKLVESVGDVLEELQPGTRAPVVGAAVAEDPDETGDTTLLQRLGFDPVGLDALCARTGQPAAALQAELLGLELDGRIARLPGGLFQRLA